jgi:hypothetical protein
MRRRLPIVPLLTAAVILLGAAVIGAQTSQAPAAPRPGGAPAAPAPPSDGRPSDAELGGLPVYPSAVFLRAYDAGRGQHYYVYGTTVPFADMVSYYKNILKEKGSLVFDVPPTHVFEIGKFRDETMAFPPSVTVKDYTFSGSAGFPNPRPGGQPERFPTLIQIVPAPSTPPLR